MALSEKNYTILKEKYNQELERAYVCNYVRNMTRNTRTELAAIYKETFNQEPTDILSTCNSCLYNGILRLARAYYQYKPEKVDNEPISNADSIQVPEETETTQEDYGTIDGLPVPQDDETPDQVPEPDETPEKENVTPKKTQNKKATTKKK